MLTVERNAIVAIANALLCFGNRASLPMLAFGAASVLGAAVATLLPETKPAAPAKAKLSTPSLNIRL